MSAKLNLAPEVYQSSQRNKRRRHLATTIGTAVTAVSIGLIIVGLLVLGAQAGLVAVLNKDIKSRQAKVAEVPNLQDAVTAQQHLKSWNDLQNQKIYMSRFFKVLQSLAPEGLAASNVTISSDNLVELTATAKTYDVITKFAKALEASNREIGENASPTQPAFFTDVTIKSADNSNDGKIEFRLTTQMAREVTENGQTTTSQ